MSCAPDGTGCVNWVRGGGRSRYNFEGGQVRGKTETGYSGNDAKTQCVLGKDPGRLFSEKDRKASELRVSCDNVSTGEARVGCFYSAAVPRFLCTCRGEVFGPHLSQGGADSTSTSRCGDLAGQVELPNCQLPVLERRAMRPPRYRSPHRDWLKLHDEGNRSKVRHRLLGGLGFCS